MLFSMYVSYLFSTSLLVFATNTATSESNICYNCDRSSNPADCDAVIRCGPHEVCSIKQLLTPSGDTYYKSGCESRMYCNLIGKKRLLDSVICAECCDTNYCNKVKCGSPVKQNSENGTRCQECKAVNDPAECNTVTQCDEDQVCYTEQFISFNSRKFRLGCRHKSACLSLESLTVRDFNKRSIFCSKCCDSENCNRNLCQTNNQRLNTTIGSTTVLPPNTTTFIVASSTDGHISQFMTTQKNTQTQAILSRYNQICEDYQDVNCDPSMAGFICRDPHFSQFCRKTCGLCGNSPINQYTNRQIITSPRITPTTKLVNKASRRPKITPPDLQALIAAKAALLTTETTTQNTITSPTLTSAYIGKTTQISSSSQSSNGVSNTSASTLIATPLGTLCNDSGQIDCSDTVLLSVICQYQDFAKKYCRQSCGFCDI